MCHGLVSSPIYIVAGRNRVVLSHMFQGPLFEKHVSKDVQRPFKGSAMVVNERNKDGFIQKIASDVYVKEGIWDLEKAQVIPFRTTMRWQTAKAS